MSSYKLEFKTVLKVTKNDADLENIKVGDVIEVKKEDSYFIPLGKPIEFMDDDFHFIGKAVINRAVLEKDRSTFEIQVLKIFTPEESKVFTDNYLKGYF